MPWAVFGTEDQAYLRYVHVAAYLYDKVFVHALLILLIDGSNAVPYYCKITKCSYCFFICKIM